MAAAIIRVNLPYCGGSDPIAKDQQKVTGVRPYCKRISRRSHPTMEGQTLLLMLDFVLSLLNDAQKNQLNIAVWRSVQAKPSCTINISWSPSPLQSSKVLVRLNFWHCTEDWRGNAGRGGGGSLLAQLYHCLETSFLNQPAVLSKHSVCLCIQVKVM